MGRNLGRLRYPWRLRSGLAATQRAIAAAFAESGVSGKWWSEAKDGHVSATDGGH
jgi:ribose 5-phosphate isomerase A